MDERENVIETLESCVAKPLRRKGDKFVIWLGVQFVNTIIDMLKEQEWHTTKEKLPKDGSVLDIVIGEDENGRIAITAALVKDSKIMFHVGDAPNAKDGYGDVTDHVLKWHKVPNIIRKEDGLYWED